MRTVISLTSIPSRFPKIAPTLKSLLAQRAAIDEIRLVIPKRYRRFPDYDGTPPEVPEGITLVQPDDDLGPATKVLFTARDLRGDDAARVLFCDDDRLYAPDWAAKLLAEHDRRPNDVIALAGWEVEVAGLAAPADRLQPRAMRRDRRYDWEYRWRRIKQQWKLRTLRATRRKPPRQLMAQAGYVDVFEGYGGVVIRPQMFDDQAYDIPAVCWTVDDVWLSGMIARQGARIWVPAGLYAPQTTEADDADALWRSVIDGADNPSANATCAAYLQENFGVWR